MKRGTAKFISIIYGKYLLYIRRSSDGTWTDNGVPVKTGYVKTVDNGTGIKVLGFVMGEYYIGLGRTK